MICQALAFEDTEGGAVLRLIIVAMIYGRVRMNVAPSV